MGEKKKTVTDFAMAFDLSIVNTFLEKRTNHLVTFKSGGRHRRSQDFCLEGGHPADATQPASAVHTFEAVAGASFVSVHAFG